MTRPLARFESPTGAGNRPEGLPAGAHCQSFLHQHGNGQRINVELWASRKQYVVRLSDGREFRGISRREAWCRFIEAIQNGEVRA